MRNSLNRSSSRVSGGACPPMYGGPQDDAFMVSSIMVNLTMIRRSSDDAVVLFRLVWR